MARTPAAFGKTYDLLLSYRRTDQEFGEQLARRLAANFGVRVFLDVKTQEPGLEWERYWREALRKTPEKKLDPSVGPGVLVLATDHILEGKAGTDHVIREIDDAVAAQRGDHVIPIYVLRFSEAGYNGLVDLLKDKSTSKWDARQHHHPKTWDDVPIHDVGAIDEASWDAICRAAVRPARAAVLRRLEGLRREAATWARDVLSSFLSPEIRLDRTTAQTKDLEDRIRRFGVATGPKRLAVVGPGGYGKTVRLATSLLAAVKSQAARFFPVLVTANELESGIQTVRAKLGLGPDLAAEPTSSIEEVYAWTQGPIVLITDSLERCGDVRKTAGVLAELGKSVGLWITCRREAWDDANKALNFTAKEVIEIGTVDANTVIKALKEISPAAVVARPYLQQPLFIDIAAYLLKQSKANRDAVLTNSTALLDAFKSWAIGRGDTRPRQARMAELSGQLLDRLAFVQIRGYRFETRKAAVLSETEQAQLAWQEAYERLTKTHPFIIENGPADNPVIRLRHDIIDSHNISNLLLNEAAQRRRLLDGLDKGFTQVVFEGVVEIAHHRQREDINDEFFDELLLSCDNKNDEPFQTRGWNAGYVVQNQIERFVHRIATCLGGEYLGNRQPQSLGERISRLTPPRLTQNALSSAAFMFRGATALQIDDPNGRVLAILRTCIDRPDVKRKARLIEALAKFDDRAEGALKALLALSRDQARLASDPGVSIYIAAGLCDVARAMKSQPAAAAAVDAIDRMRRQIAELVAAGSIDRPTLRTLSDLGNGISDQAKRKKFPDEPFNAEEIEQGLSLHAFRSPADVSDWLVFEKYATGLLSQRNSKFDGPWERPILALALQL
jgi:hypothetical protein